MNLDRAVIKNHLVGICCLLVAAASEMPPEIMAVLPPHWRHRVTIVALVILWLKSHWNLFINPDSTPAAVGYVNKRNE